MVKESNAFRSAASHHHSPSRKHIEQVQLTDREVEDLFHRGFREYYLGNTIGYMPPIGNINDDSFNRFLRRLLASMESSMNDFSKIVFAE